ncbi:unnamed protein product [Acanthoscelides obtectus]|uniref:Uncharacterized protein n=1 Tax=Acanthoscelides obtectus TaxID=200917 RepID=A0A9P0LHL6_ACAOB|nr:unnamed protein product [Acanthoscelides obtectus]CAK1626134.1 hypothetical protein AOBTE_LOCUS3639 [Acanthoscelides obtectus]
MGCNKQFQLNSRSVHQKLGCRAARSHLAESTFIQPVMRPYHLDYFNGSSRLALANAGPFYGASIRG